MARRRRPHGGGSYGPPVAIAQKSSVLDVGGLARAYEWLAVDQDLGYRLAFDWYAANSADLMGRDPMSAEQQKTYDRAVKARALGECAGAHAPERAQANSTALRLFERVWASKPLPRVDDALANPNPSQHVKNVQAVLANLNAAFGPWVGYRAAFGAKRACDAKIISVPVVEIDRMIGQAPLKTALDEVPTAAQVASVVRNAAGRDELDGGAFMTNLPLILAAVEAWAETMAGALLKPLGKGPKAGPAGKAAKTGAPRAARAAGSSRVKATNPKIIRLAAMLRTGTTQMQVVAAIPGWNLDSAKWYIAETAKAFGLTVTRRKNAAGETVFTAV